MHLLTLALTHTHTHTHTHTLAASFQDQLSSYLGQMDSPEYAHWVAEAIEKEKMKQQHLRGVISHLETEVTNLAKDTVKQMQKNMLHVSVCVWVGVGVCVYVWV